MEAVFVNIPCPTKEEAIKLCRGLLERELCATTKIHPQVQLLWNEDGVQQDEVVLITLKTTDENIPQIHQFIFENHSWQTPCIEVVPILRDLC